MNKTINQVMGYMGMKLNNISITEVGKVYISKDNEQGFFYSMGDVKLKLMEKEFSNIINVTVSGPNGCIGPDFKPSQKAIKRLLSIIKGTTYKVIAQNKFNFTIEGEN